MNGKGDSPRPYDTKRWDANYAEIDWNRKPAGLEFRNPMTAYLGDWEVEYEFPPCRAVYTMVTTPHASEHQVRDDFAREYPDAVIRKIKKVGQP